MAKEFIQLATSYSTTVQTPIVNNKEGQKIGGGNKYRFFKNRPYLVKDKDDIKFFEKHDGFKEVKPSKTEKQLAKEAKAAEKAKAEADVEAAEADEAEAEEAEVEAKEA